MKALELRTAGPDDAEQVALLHADSWRRHYRGAFADSFLDGDIVADRRSTWSARLAAPADTATFVAEDGAGLVGFVHVVFDDDSRWGSLVDNLHVRNDSRRTGIGTRLLASAARAVVERAPSRRMFLWVLEQNTAAQRFYQALGGVRVEKAKASAKGIPLNGSPNKFRVAWPDATVLAAKGGESG